MLEIVVMIIGAILVWRLINAGFALGARATAATERTAELLAFGMSPEARDRYVAMCEEREMRKRAAATTKRIATAIIVVVLIALYAAGARADESCGLFVKYASDNIHFIVRGKTGERIILGGDNSKYTWMKIIDSGPPSVVCWEPNEDYIPLPQQRPSGAPR